MRIVLLLLVFGACHKANPSCEQAVKHVVKMATAGPPGSEPKADEQRAIDTIVDASIDRCTEEGLSDAQRDCILAAKSLQDRAFLSCPALVAKPPSWIIAPIGHPEAIDELEKQLRDTPRKP